MFKSKSLENVVFNGVPVDNNDDNASTSAGGSDGDKTLTIVTGTSNNHFGILFHNLIASVKWRIMDRIDESYFDHVRFVVYDLDREERLISEHKRKLANIPFAEYRVFNYTQYPEHFDINQIFHGQYAWKPAIIEEIVKEEQQDSHSKEISMVYWIDSGLLVSSKCKDFGPDIEHALVHGIYTVRSIINISFAYHLTLTLTVILPYN